MNDRERFLAVAQFEKPDYVPLMSCNGIDGPLPETVQTWQEKQGAPERLSRMPVAEELGPEWTSLLGATGPLQRAWDTFWGMTRLHYWGPGERDRSPGSGDHRRRWRVSYPADMPTGLSCARCITTPSAMACPNSSATPWPDRRIGPPIVSAGCPWKRESIRRIGQPWPHDGGRAIIPLRRGCRAPLACCVACLGTAQACTILYDAPDTARDILNACCEIDYQSIKSAKARLGRPSCWLSQMAKLCSAALAAKRAWNPLRS